MAQRAEVRVAELEMVAAEGAAHVPAVASSALHAVLRLVAAVEKAARAFCGAGLLRLAERGYEVVESLAARLAVLELADAAVASGLPAWPGQPSMRDRSSARRKHSSSDSFLPPLAGAKWLV